MLARLMTVIVISVSSMASAADICNYYGSTAGCRDEEIGTKCTVENGREGTCQFSYFRLCECAEVRRQKKEKKEEGDVSKKN